MEEAEWNAAGGRKRCAQPHVVDETSGGDGDGDDDDNATVEEKAKAKAKAKKGVNDAVAPATIVSVVDAADAPVDEVGKWLEDIGMEQYHKAFIDFGFDTILSLKMLDNDDLDSMGITILGHKRIILTAARTLSATHTSP